MSDILYSEFDTRVGQGWRTPYNRVHVGLESWSPNRIEMQVYSSGERVNVNNIYWALRHEIESQSGVVAVNLFGSRGYNQKLNIHFSDEVRSHQCVEEWCVRVFHMLWRARVSESERWEEEFNRHLALEAGHDEYNSFDWVD